MFAFRYRIVRFECREQFRHCCNVGLFDVEVDDGVVSEVLLVFAIWSLCFLNAVSLDNFVL